MKLSLLPLLMPKESKEMKDELAFCVAPPKQNSCQALSMHQAVVSCQQETNPFLDSEISGESSGLFPKSEAGTETPPKYIENRVMYKGSPNHVLEKAFRAKRKPFSNSETALRKFSLDGATSSTILRQLCITSNSPKDIAASSLNPQISNCEDRLLVHEINPANKSKPKTRHSKGFSSSKTIPSEEVTQNSPTHVASCCKCEESIENGQKNNTACECIIF